MMHVIVKGKQIDVGDALRSHVESALDDAVSKYFDHALEGAVVFSRDGQSFLRCDITVHVGRVLQMRGGGEAGGRGDVDDAAPTQCPELWREYVTAINNAPEINVHRGVPIGHSGIADVLAASADTSIVNDQVNGCFQ